MDNSFLGLNFTPLALEHRSLITKIFNKFPQKLSAYCSGFLFAWNPIYSYAFSQIENTLILSFSIKATGQRHLLQPIGPFPKNVQKQLLDSFSQIGYPLKILAVSESFLNEYPDFCSRFKKIDDRNNANYLYKAQDLAHLAGRHYEKKRNLIYQCDSLYSWNIKTLPECTQYEVESLLEIGSKNTQEETESLKDEKQAINRILSHFRQLDQKSVIIFIDQKPVAYSIYEKLNPVTAIIHFEKAERQFKGLYQLINRETAKKIENEGFLFINREEDMGIDGLRKAKLSYFPYALIPSFTLESEGDKNILNAKI